MISPISFAALQPTQKASPTQAIEQDIQRLEQLRDLTKLTGNSARCKEMEQLIALRKQQMATAAKGPRQFTEQERDAIQASLVPGRKGVEAAVPADLQAPLGHFQRLLDQGVQITDSKMHDLDPAEAFVKLVEVPFHGPDDQIMFKTWANGFMTSSTLRAEYLPSLTYYAEKTRDGVVFYEDKKGEHVRIDSPHDFIRCYKTDPEKALTRTPDDKYLSLEDAKAHQKELERVLTVINEGPGGADQPKVEDLGESISIGGIVIKKRAS